MPTPFPSRSAPPESEDPSAAFVCSAAHLLRMTGIYDRKRRRCDRDQPLSATTFGCVEGKHAIAALRLLIAGHSERSAHLARAVEESSDSGGARRGRGRSRKRRRDGKRCADAVPLAPRTAGIGRSFGGARLLRRSLAQDDGHYDRKRRRCVGANRSPRQRSGPRRAAPGSLAPLGMTAGPANHS